MAESAVRWQSPDGSAHKPALRPAGDDHVRVVEFRAQVRAAGESWVGGRPGEFRAWLESAAAGDPALAALVLLGGELIEAFLEGHEHRPDTGAGTADAMPVDFADDLIEGRAVPAEVEERLAAAYVVAVVRPQNAVVEPSAATVLEVLPTGALVTRCDTGVVILVPDEDERGATPDIQELVHSLVGPAWVGMARGPRPRIAEVFREAEEVTRLVVAGRRPDGVYRVGDVLVEYAVTRHEGVTANLLAVIRPLCSHTVLWTTLTALIDADYVRNQAAKALFIHRSTLDYRLQRIAQVTGYDPMSGRDAQVLTAAMIAHAVR